MKCPKCGYHSFDHLDSCKKCNNDLVAHKAKFNLRGFFSPGQPAVVAVASESVIDESDEDLEESSDGSVDFGFDFLEEEDQAGRATEDIPLGDNDQDINIDQPFGADSETLPADSLDFDEDDDDKPGKGPEFAF
jgi:hypothetical protein